MRLIRSIRQVKKVLSEFKKKGRTIGFVPTMGALHQGHLSLIRKARRSNGLVAVSIFVNPIQFGPREDLKSYPWDLKKDLRSCRQCGVDIIFCPSVKEMYGRDHKTSVTVKGLDSRLCGEFRPGHFQGVATVVVKLLNIIQPDTAYFGQKDAQQAIIIKKVVSDLNIPVRIEVMPIVREKDGLAMSSRNVYLNARERNNSAILRQALKAAAAMARGGAIKPAGIIKKMRKMILNKGGRAEYISIVDPQELTPLKNISGKALIALAVYFGKTRLIDNITIEA